MADHGSKRRLMPVARSLYVIEGKEIAEISEILKVSKNTLYKWKADSRIPGHELDEWDKARNKKRAKIERLNDLFDDQLDYVESLHASERTPAMADGLSKFGALVEKWEKAELVVRRLAQQGKNGEDEQKDVTIDAATIKDLREQFGL